MNDPTQTGLLAQPSLTFASCVGDMTMPPDDASASTSGAYGVFSLHDDGAAAITASTGSSRHASSGGPPRVYAPVVRCLRPPASRRLSFFHGALRDLRRPLINARNEASHGGWMISACPYLARVAARRP